MAKTLTAVAVAQALEDRKGETQAEVSRIGQWSDLIRGNPQADVTAFIRNPKGKEAKDHPAVLRMVENGMLLASALVRWSEAKQIATAYTNGMLLTDAGGKVRFMGWKAAVYAAREFRKGVRESATKQQAERERNELIGQLAAVAPKGTPIEDIYEKADAMQAHAEANAENAKALAKARKAADEAGCIVLPKGIKPADLAALILATFDKDKAESVADTILSKLLESDKAKPEAFTAPEPAKTHTGETAKAV